MDDLTAFIAARLDEEEAAAKAATEGPWAWEATGDKDSSWAVGQVQDEDGTPLAGEIEQGQGIVIDGVCEGIDRNLADAAHIALHDPARALREVATWRAILAARPPADGAEFRSGFNAALGFMMQAKAREYSDHPDWRMDGHWGR